MKQAAAQAAEAFAAVQRPVRHDARTAPGDADPRDRDA